MVNFITGTRISGFDNHDGLGCIKATEIFGSIKQSINHDDNEKLSPWDFVLYVIVPPQSSIGLHQHGNNEEMYIILKGSGLMTINDQQKKVSEGDVIFNKPNWKHGLLNDKDQDIELLVIQASLK